MQKYADFAENIKRHKKWLWLQIRALAKVYTVFLFFTCIVAVTELIILLIKYNSLALGNCGVRGIKCFWTC